MKTGCDGEGIILHIQKKNNIGTPIDIEEAIIHSRCHFSQSSSCGSNRKNQGGCREDKISDSRYSAAGKIIIFLLKVKII
jgi:hypothetical protein